MPTVAVAATAEVTVPTRRSAFVHTPPKSYDVFISYARVDDTWAAPLAQASVWVPAHV